MSGDGTEESYFDNDYLKWSILLGLEWVVRQQVGPCMYSLT